MKRTIGTAGLWVLLASAPGVARAESLDETAAHLASDLQKLGVAVERLPTRFLHDGEMARIPVPSDSSRPCTSLILLGARGMNFLAQLAGPNVPLTKGTGAVEASAAGALMMVSCEEDQGLRVLVKNQAGRGALEVLLVKSEEPLPPLGTFLPERSNLAGGAMTMVDPGSLPPLEVAAQRAQSAEQRALRDGGHLDSRRSVPMGEDGMGVLSLSLEAGCHRIEIFGEDRRRTRRSKRLDIDAELRDDDGDILARDRTEAPDARIETCLGEATGTTLVMAGAEPATDAMVTHALWPIPDRLPWVWEGQARARMAQALLAHRARVPDSLPVFLTQGTAGSTAVPLALQPGACYLAAAAIAQGSPRGLGLRVRVSGRDYADDRGVGGVGAVVAFCTGASERAVATVDARGAALAWGLVIYQMHTLPSTEGTP